MNNRALALAAAKAYGISPSVFLRQINQESGFNPNARSSAGALGIAQFMPATARSMGVNPLDPKSALFGAARMDARNLAKYHNWRDALSIYNSGRGWSTGQKIGQTNNYVRSILGGASASVPAGPTGRAAPLAPSAPAAPQVGGGNAAISYLLQTSQDLAAGKTPDPGSLLAFAQTRQASQATQAIGAQTAQFVSDHPGKLSPNAPGVVKLAEHYLGTKYLWGGSSPKTGFDCSGFVQWLYGQKGVKLGRTTYQQIKQGQPVGRNQLAPGDVVFFKQGSDVHHEGMYIGHNQFIHAPHTGDVVRISSLSTPYYAQQFAGGRRMA